MCLFLEKMYGERTWQSFSSQVVLVQLSVSIKWLVDEQLSSQEAEYENQGYLSLWDPFILNPSLYGPTSHHQFECVLAGNFPNVKRRGKRKIKVWFWSFWYKISLNFQEFRGHQGQGPTSHATGFNPLFIPPQQWRI